MCSVFSCHPLAALTSLTRRTTAAAEATPISAVTTNRSTASTESQQGAWLSGETN